MRLRASDREMEAVEIVQTVWGRGVPRRATYAFCVSHRQTQRNPHYCEFLPAAPDRAVICAYSSDGSLIWGQTRAEGPPIPTSMSEVAGGIICSLCAGGLPWRACSSAIRAGTMSLRWP